MMKKIASLITAISMVVAFAVPGLASAAPATPAVKPKPAKTTVAGMVSNNGKPVKHAKVTVVCNNHAATTTTNNAGQYSVTFKSGACPVGDTVTVVATKGGKGGVSTGVVMADTMKMNVAIVNVSVPELSVFTGVGATVAAGAGFMVIRRRQTAALQE